MSGFKGYNQKVIEDMVDKTIKDLTDEINKQECKFALWTNSEEAMKEFDKAMKEVAKKYLL